MKKSKTGRPKGDLKQNKIIKALFEEMLLHGPEGVSIEKVAVRAGVNKTSIYRKFKSKEALIAYALEKDLESKSTDLEDCGSVKKDLEKILSKYVESINTKKGQALYLSAVSPIMSKEIEIMMMKSPVIKPQEILELVARAQSRGEWDPKKRDPRLIFTILIGSINHRVMLERLPITSSWLNSLLDCVTGSLV